MLATQQRIGVKPGETVELTLPYSEACLHMKVAGRRHRVRLISDVQAQLMRGENDLLGRELPLGGTLLPCEVGFYEDSDGFYFLE